MQREQALAELRMMIRSLLTRAVDFQTFEPQYVEFFADNAADEYFNQSDIDLYTALFEKLQWTAPAPSGIERAVGYSSVSATEQWIRMRFPELA